MAASASPPTGARARAWCRADLAGGTLDIWPLGLLHRRSRTINVALDVAVDVQLKLDDRSFRLRQGESVLEASSANELAASEEGALVGLIAAALKLPPVEVTVRSASPRGGGLGASSALAVAVIAAGEALLGDVACAPERRAALARDIEAQLMGLPTGRQDHFPALLGGLLEIRHEPGGERVRRLDADVAALGRSLLVVYTGVSHFSAANNWRIIQRRLEEEPEAVRCLDGIRDAAEHMAGALERGELARVGELMSLEWGWRRRLAEGISTPLTERLLQAGRDAGAWGGKACGAGGGGCLALLCPAEQRQHVAAALAEEGGLVLPTEPVDEPLRVEQL